MGLYPANKISLDSCFVSRYLVMGTFGSFLKILFEYLKAGVVDVAGALVVCAVVEDDASGAAAEAWFWEAGTRLDGW